MGQIDRLRRFYANGNRISAVPAEISTLNEIEVQYCFTVDFYRSEDISDTTFRLQTINLANNLLKELPVEWLERWGQYIPQLGSLGGEGSSMSPCSVVLLGNPLV